jgi:hypothetical protein
LTSILSTITTEWPCWAGDESRFTHAEEKACQTSIPSTHPNTESFTAGGT